jgi:protein gp37
LSIEPMLGPIDLRLAFAGHCPEHDFPGGFCVQRYHQGVQHIDWVIAGGESGSKARPVHPDWIRSLRDQCADAGVPFLFKQWGEYAYSGTGVRLEAERVGKKLAGRLLDGVEHNAFPVPR